MMILLRICGTLAVTLYIINDLMRNFYTRNVDLIFDIVETKNETLQDKTKN